MHALKLENLDLNKKRADILLKIIKNFAEKIGYESKKIENLDCRSRDGFLPHSYNKGGISCCFFGLQRHIEYTGFKNADNTLKKYFEYDIETFIANKKHLLKDQSNWADQDYENFDEYRQNDDQADILFSMDIMLKSENELNLRLCVCVKDAPYHRKFDDLISIDIKFKNLIKLKSKLNKVLKRKIIQKFSNNVKE